MPPTEDSNDSNTPEKKSSSPMRQVAMAESLLQFAIALPVGCVLGWLLGGLADRALHQHWIAILGVILGAVGGFMQIYRVATNYMNSNK